MKRFLIAMLAVLLFIAPAIGDTAVSTPTFETKGGFVICTFTLTGDVAGGAVSDEEIDLSILYSHSKPYHGTQAWYLYYVETIPGAGAAAPDAYTVTFTDDDGGTVLALAARSTNAKEYADAGEDLPNYWPVTGNLTLAAGDIGASNSTTIKLIFVR